MGIRDKLRRNDSRSFLSRLFRLISPDMTPQSFFTMAETEIGIFAYLYLIVAFVRVGRAYGRGHARPQVLDLIED